MAPAQRRGAARGGAAALLLLLATARAAAAAAADAQAIRATTGDGEGGLPVVRGATPEVRAAMEAARQRGNFQCGDGSTVPWAKVNDDFCDCAGDGSDEPGTNACAKGTFYCRNRGFKPAKLPKSRVNDLVCDCCDGSDEFLHADLCPNTCKEAGASIRQELADKATRYAAGNAVRAASLEQASNTKKGWSTELGGIDAKWDQMQKEIDEIKARKEAAEKAEEAAAAARQAEDDAEALRRAAETLADGEMSADAYLKWCEDGGEERKKFCLAEAAAANEEAQEDGGAADASASAATATTTATTVAAGEGEREETEAERGQRIARQWTRSAEAAGNTDTPEDPGDALLRENGELDEEKPAPPASGAAAESEVQRLSRELADKERELRELNSKKDDLSKRIQHNYGDMDALVGLVGKCVESNAETKGGGAYKYRVCPFDKAQQDGLALGNFESVEYTMEGATLKFTNGAKCWNGPHRTMTATLVCGASERMLSVDEPSVCEYTSVVETPAVCTDAIVASVRHAHEQMELDAHDELRR